MTPQQKTRMVHQEDLAVCRVGGAVVYGSLNEYETARLVKGDRVRYVTSDGREGEGVVKGCWYYEAPMINLENGMTLCSSFDVIEKMECPKCC